MDAGRLERPAPAHDPPRRQNVPESPWAAQEPPTPAQIAAAAQATATAAGRGVTPGRMPAVYLGHGAPPLVDDALWVAELTAWAGALPRPRAILVVSAHWETHGVTLGATADAAPLVYDFYGFPERYYRATYSSPGAPALAAPVRRLVEPAEPVAEEPARGLDHGAYVPLLVMYPGADVPVLQLSLPSLEPHRLLALGERLRPLRDEGVLIMGSGFLTHGLPFLRDFRSDAPPPEWSEDFDAWAAATLARGDAGALAGFGGVPSAQYAHPRAEHFVPLLVTVGAGEPGSAPVTPITGYFVGLSKRSVQFA
jgi:4,5-DOPA dioxygenase extradiol